MVHGLTAKNEAPGRCDSQGLLPFIGRLRRQAGCLLLSVQPFANVVCDYTRRDGENKRINV